MSFRITGLDPASFIPLYGLGDAELATRGASRRIVGPGGGIPDRVEVRDAREGETVILLNHVHQPAATAYRASHATFILEGATQAAELIDEVPDVIASRLISLRAFSEGHELVTADIVPGTGLADLIERFFEDPSVAYLHAHYAKPGCYAARVDRV